MNLNLHNDLVNRVKRMLRPGIASPYQPERRADHLVKMNLSPLMGRRDAACDRAALLINQDVFVHAEEWRAKVYAAVSLLLMRAESDTRAILATLSSPDTESREKSLLNFISLTRNIALSLCDFVELEEELLCEEGSPLKEFSASPSDSELARNERMLSESEINLVNQLRACFDRSRPKLTRYREYTGKSFSPSNASRYKKAFEAYSALFHDEYQFTTD